MKIAVIGIGYVGLANAILLSQKYEVVAYDTSNLRLEQIAKRCSPIADRDCEMYLKKKDLKLKVTTNIKDALSDADYIIISTPTNYDSDKNYFDTSSVEQTLDKIMVLNGFSLVVIKSTVPVGFTEKMRKQYAGLRILFSPEFLREGRALHDNLYPSRIVVGADDDLTHKAAEFADMLRSCSLKPEVPILVTKSTEAEAIKLFANSYLALRIAFFNELDTYAECREINATDVIKGVCYDPRIGDYYNNPSFGYGGYCLPKDTKQLLANYENVPNNIISAIVEANRTRKDFISEQIILHNPKTVGIFRLVMKSDSDNFRQSAVLGIMKRLSAKGIRIIIYEPEITSGEFLHSAVLNDLEEFKQVCDVIITNRFSTELSDVSYKVYSRDLFRRD